jgi:hypothetical protein
MRDEIASQHADLRLMQRAQTLDESVTEVWESAIECEVAYHGYDEARVSPEHDIVLLKEDGQIVTCLNETHNVTIDGDSLESYLAAAINEDDTDE